jgi:hypothetical protein
MKSRIDDCTAELFAAGSNLLVRGKTLPEVLLISDSTSLYYYHTERINSLLESKRCCRSVE